MFWDLFTLNNYFLVNLITSSPVSVAIKTLQVGNLFMLRVTFKLTVSFTYYYLRSWLALLCLWPLTYHQNSCPFLILVFGLYFLQNCRDLAELFLIFWYLPAKLQWDNMAKSLPPSKDLFKVNKNKENKTKINQSYVALNKFLRERITFTDKYIL